MELKQGYNKSEAATMPAEWSVRPLGDLFRFSNGVNADKRAYGHGYRFVNVLEPITYSHLVGPEIPGRVSIPSGVAEAYAVRRGDVLFNRTSETDSELGLASTYLGDEHVVFGGFVIRGRPIDDSLDPVYSGYALRAQAVRSQIIPLGQGAVRANIGQQRLSLVMVPVPPLAEQKAIAEALSDVDALLGGLDRLIVKKRDIRTATMQQLLTGKTRLPGFEGEWDAKRLGEIADIAIGRTPSRANPTFWGGSHKWLAISDLRAKYLADTAEAITDAGAAGMTLIPAGALVMSFKLSIGRLGFASVDMYSNEAICAFRNLKANAEYLYYALSRVDFSQYGKQAVKGFTLNSESLRAVAVPYPPVEEQRAIAEVLSDMDAEIAALDARRDKTAQVKKAMMQELLTGKTRLV